MDASERYHQAWKTLLADVARRLDPRKQYCAVPSIRGSKYESGGIAIVGRAPNGWVFPISMDDCSSDDRRAKLASRIVSVHVCTAPGAQTIDGRPECGRMHWVVHPYRYKGAVRVNSQFGRFWPMVAGVIQAHLGPGNVENWEETIAWTNLYPFSYEFGNPSARLAHAQREASAELLRIALRDWRPRVAIFITEVNSLQRRTLEWSESFHAALEITDLRRRSDGPVVATGKLKDRATCVIFVVRPDSRHGVRYNFTQELISTLTECDEREF
jgi:hypothetical protein